MGHFILGIIVGLIAIFVFSRTVMPKLARKNAVKDAELRGFSAGKNYNPKFSSFDDSYRNTYTADHLREAYDNGFKRGTARRDEINAIVKVNAAAYQK
jgi:hypothetical protein